MAQIDIYVECDWELRPKNYDANKVTKRGYVGNFKGGYSIKSPGHPEINGGMGTPDMMALFPTVKSIKDRLMKEYGHRYPGDTVKIHIKITKDDRNPTMDNFFG